MDISDYTNALAGVPPPGVVSNIENAEWRAIEAHLGMGVHVEITAMFSFLRMYVKLFVEPQQFGLKDPFSPKPIPNTLAKIIAQDLCRTGVAVHDGL